MNEILRDLNSPSWWFTAVVIGLIVSVAANNIGWRSLPAVPRPADASSQGLLNVLATIVLATSAIIFAVAYFDKEMWRDQSPWALLLFIPVLIFITAFFIARALKSKPFRAFALGFPVAFFSAMTVIFLPGHPNPSNFWFNALAMTALALFLGCFIFVATERLVKWFRSSM